MFLSFVVMRTKQNCSGHGWCAKTDTCVCDPGERKTNNHHTARNDKLSNDAMKQKGFTGANCGGAGDLGKACTGNNDCDTKVFVRRNRRNRVCDISASCIRIAIQQCFKAMPSDAMGVCCATAVRGSRILSIRFDSFALNYCSVCAVQFGVQHVQQSGA
jgi:hypothetical protein